MHNRNSVLSVMLCEIKSKNIESLQHKKYYAPKTGIEPRPSDSAPRVVPQSRFSHDGQMFISILQNMLRIICSAHATNAHRLHCLYRRKDVLLVFGEIDYKTWNHFLFLSAGQWRFINKIKFKWQRTVLKKKHKKVPAAAGI
jgi:hypothetical protein